MERRICQEVDRIGLQQGGTDATVVYLDAVNLHLFLLLRRMKTASIMRRIVILLPAILMGDGQLLYELT